MFLKVIIFGTSLTDFVLANSLSTGLGTSSNLVIANLSKSSTISNPAKVPLG